MTITIAFQYNSLPPETEMMVGNDVDGKSYRNSYIDSTFLISFCLTLH